MKSSRPRPVILVTEPAYFRSELNRLSKIGRVVLGTPDPRDIRRRIRRCDAAVIRVETVLDRAALSNAPNLRLIASATTGINHIDTETARRLGIAVLHLHGTHTIPTAEHMMALLLCLSRRIAEVQDPMKAGRWDRERWIGTQLSGKTLGIIGLGRIGKTVAKFAGAFGMTVLAYDPYVRPNQAPAVRFRANLSSLLSRSDIVSIHAALTPETRGMINRRRLREFKRGSLLINTARGEIVDETDLIRALKSGRPAGAALDVYAVEPLPPGSPLRAYARRHPNLILTPHLGASTAEAVRAAAREITAGVEKFFR